MASRCVQVLAVSAVVGVLGLSGHVSFAAEEDKGGGAASRQSAESTMEEVTVTGQRNASRHVMGTREYIAMLENLGDLYARMAAQVYGEAVQLESTRAMLASKLALIEQVLVSVPSSMGAGSKTVDGRAAMQATSVPAVQPAVVTAGTQADSKRATAAVTAAVLAWAQAWEQQDLPAYYAAYSEQFEPVQGTLEAWKKERRARIEGRSAITVDFNDLQVQIQGDTATANFHQSYSSGEYQSHARKHLQLQQEEGRWRIVREESDG